MELQDNILLYDQYDEEDEFDEEEFEELDEKPENHTYSFKKNNIDPYTMPRSGDSSAIMNPIIGMIIVPSPSIFITSILKIFFVGILFS